MRRLGQVEPTGGTAWRLCPQGLAHPCATHISNGEGANATIGLSQVHTTRNRGKVDGFKHIHPSDRPAFQPAALFHDDHLFDDAAEAEAARRSAPARMGAAIRKMRATVWAYYVDGKLILIEPKGWG